MDCTSDAFVHGAGGCRACFSDVELHWHALSGQEFADRSPERRGTGRSWRLRANPGYWGAPDPEILVLGFSKGGDQQELLDLHVRGRKRFEDVPFNSVKSSMRQDLVDLLVTMGLVAPKQNANELFTRTTGRFGFASLIRCSVSMRPPGQEDYVFSGSGILERTVESGQPFVNECIARHLQPLPASVRLVVMLSSSKHYISACHDLLGGDWVAPTAEHRYAYRVNGVPFIHVPHPSGQAGGFRAAFNGIRGPRKGEEGMPECRKQALAVVAAAGIAIAA